MISEFSPCTEPRRHTFPQRNRIVTGLSEAVVVVQAGPRSGALISADFALQQGRELCAVPGSVREPLAQGTNDLLKDGAHFVTCTQDVLDLVHGVATAPAPTDALGLQILEALGLGAASHDLSTRLQTPPEQIERALARLELGGQVRATLFGYSIPEPVRTH
ncbi:MAG: DNA-processing protein DprA [Planctomycetes bacterium]|nr:DNA-processing protein DprA [Planctomycetota bacterium]